MDGETTHRVEPGHRSKGAGRPAVLCLLLACLLPKAADAAVATSPATVSVLPGETSPPVRLTLTFPTLPPRGFTGTVEVLLPPALDGNTSVTPSPVTYQTAVGSTTARTTLRFVTTAATPPGSWRVTVRDLGLGAGGGTVTLQVLRPTVSAQVHPSPVELESGGPPGSATVTTLAGTGFSQPIRYELVGLPPQLQHDGPRVSAPPDFPAVSFALRALPGAAEGIFAGRLRGTSGGRVVVDLPLPVRVSPPVPVIERVVPDRLAAGTLSRKVRLVGRNFEPGARIESDLPRLRVEAVRVLSPRLAEVTVSVDRDAPASVAGLRLLNPSGGQTPVPGRVTLLPPGSLAAPLTVTAVAVVHPRPGGQIAEDEEVLPRGLVAAAGSGPVSGSWLLDGVPFDRFVLRVVAGQPVAVTARVPIPRLARGSHRLALRVEEPDEVSSPEVTVLLTRERASGLRLLSPADGAALAPEPVRLSWSLVPGALAYRVEVEVEAETGKAVRRLDFETAEASVELAMDDLRRLALLAPTSGRFRWRVRALFAETGDAAAAGEPTPWHELTLLGAPSGPRFQSGPGRRGGEPPGGMPAGFRLLPAGHGGESLRALLGSPQLARQLISSEPDAPEATVTGEASALSWSANLEAAANEFGGDEPRDPATGSLVLSGLVNREPGGEGGGAFKTTAELAYDRRLEGEEEGRFQDQSWVLQGRLGGDRQALDLQAGSGAPRFLEGLELLGAGLARGGGEARLELPADLALSLYGSFDPDLDSATTGAAAVDQELAAAALTFGGGDKRYTFQLLALETEADADPTSQAGGGRITGVSGRYQLGSGIGLELEGSRARQDALLPSETPQKGDALRLGLEGSLGSLGISLDLRHVEAGYVHPLSFDFDQAGPADRDTVALQLSQPLAGFELGLDLRHSEGGDAFGPPGTLQHGELTFARSGGERFRFSLAAGLTRTEADADEDLLLPATERSDRSFRLSLAETFGRLELTQDATLELQEAEADPLADQTTSAVALGAGAGFERGRFALSLSATRVDGDPAFGRTDSLTASLQPVWELPGLDLRLAPFLAYSETRNDLLELEDVCEHGQLTLGWDPPWAGSLLSLELSAAWSRSYARSQEPRPGFERRYTAVFTLSWGGEGARTPHAAGPPGQGTYAGLSARRAATARLAALPGSL